jgi:hypothetical protein
LEKFKNLTAKAGTRTDLGTANRRRWEMLWVRGEFLRRPTLVGGVLQNHEFGTKHPQKSPQSQNRSFSDELEVIEKNGAPGGTRTPDLLVRRKAKGSESKIYLVRLASLTDQWPLVFPTQLYPILYPGHKASPSGEH